MSETHHVQERDPQLAAHMHAVGWPPARAALPWLLRGAFGAALAPREALLLYDRIIGFDNLLPVGLLAAAILCFRCVVAINVCVKQVKIVFGGVAWDKTYVRVRHLAALPG